jgi:hypothetical protein
LPPSPPLSVLQVRVGSFKGTLLVALSVLYATASNKEDGARVVVASLLQALVPVLSADQVRSPVLPALQSLIESGSQGVVKAAAKSLTSLFGSISDRACLEVVNREIALVLERGPKQVCVVCGVWLCVWQACVVCVVCVGFVGCVVRCVGCVVACVVWCGVVWCGVG